MVTDVVKPFRNIASRPRVDGRVLQCLQRRGQPQLGGRSLDGGDDEVDHRKFWRLFLLRLLLSAGDQQQKAGQCEYLNYPTPTLRDFHR